MYIYSINIYINVNTQLDYFFSYIEVGIPFYMPNWKEKGERGVSFALIKYKYINVFSKEWESIFGWQRDADEMVFFESDACQWPVWIYRNQKKNGPSCRHQVRVRLNADLEGRLSYPRRCSVDIVHVVDILRGEFGRRLIPKKKKKVYQ